MTSPPDSPMNIAKSQFINTTADVQMEPSEVPVSAGVANLKVLFQNAKIAFPVTLTIQTSSGKHRGVHMSRLVRASSRRNAAGIEEWLKLICKEVNRTQPGSIATCKFEMPFSDQFSPVTIRTTESGSTTYQLVATGMTACPCSKKMIGIGHMQRAEIVLILRSRKTLDLSRVIGRLGECFSAMPDEEMKRAQEAVKILRAQENAKFAEDLVRDTVKRFPDALYVSARCFESIHAHDAVATWSKKPGWTPSL
ncbi:MAG: GTP cyclohydrolase I FolE2 [Thaumarchaeota archaeon]|nr:GTP cyclohydrolase I FolE2 [Nitrososphaerota archaeon]